MILTDYYKGVILTDSKCRFDVVECTEGYELFESLLINKRKFNVGGLSFNFVDRPDRWKQKATNKAITKGTSNITSVKRPDPISHFGFGDIANTNDGCLIGYNKDFQKIGIVEIVIFIARGCRNDTVPLWELLKDGELDDEMAKLKLGAVTKSVTN
ncbi:MAG: hypothetical protein RIG68_03045 [Imperialibacter sp.]|uniref:hypothetical protein n=1 Tax=Imperialibacter sp. TaxID=2038411 RepID=UPI0032EBC0D2